MGFGLGFGLEKIYPDHPTDLPTYLLLTYPPTCFLLLCLRLPQRLLVFNPSKRISVDEARPLLPPPTYPSLG